MQQASDGLVVPRTAVGHANGVHSRAPQDGVLEKEDDERKQSLNTQGSAHITTAINKAQSFPCLVHLQPYSGMEFRDLKLTWGSLHIMR